MTLEEVLNYLDISGYQLAKRLNVHRQSITTWRKTGHIPFIHQVRIQEFTGGKLMAREERGNTND